MAVENIELRVAALEAELARLKECVERAVPQGDWLDEIYGVFDNDPLYEEAMRLGSDYRESQRPGTKKKPVRTTSKKAMSKSAKSAVALRFSFTTPITCAYWEEPEAQRLRSGLT